MLKLISTEDKVSQDQKYLMARGFKGERGLRTSLRKKEGVILILRKYMVVPLFREQR